MNFSSKIDCSFFQRDASLMIKELDEIGPLPFKFAPPTSSEKLQKEGLIRKLNGIKKCDYSTNDYYDAFVEVGH